MKQFKQPLADAKYPEKDWPDKIAKAKEARKAGQKVRKAKPVKFPWTLKYRKEAGL